MPERYGIAEWYGVPLDGMSAAQRGEFSAAALRGRRGAPPCPFQEGEPPCRKSGGVCSLRRYEQGADGRLGAPAGEPVIFCPSRFEESGLLVRWLAEIVGFAPDEAMVAREVPFMEGTETNKAAGKIDLVVAKVSNGALAWHGLEIQAVYFSGEGMRSEFESLGDESPSPPFPNAIRRPDWRSSSAKRLMPQLQIKAPTLRRWGSKIAVAVDRPFFDAIGGPSPNPSRDLDDGDVIWLVPELAPDGERNRLVRGHWEVLTLERSGEKLLAARTVRRESFEWTLRAKLRPLGAPAG